MKSVKIIEAFDKLFIGCLVIFIGPLRALVVTLGLLLVVAKIASCLWQQTGRKEKRSVNKTLQM